MNETYDSPPLDRSIFERRVPGISNGELVEALQRGEKPRDEPTMNDAFSRTSPEIYQHFQNAGANALQNAGTRTAQSASEANAALQRNEPNSMSMQQEFAALRRRMLEVDASVREYHAKEMVRHGQVLETLEQMRSASTLHVWILALIGAVVIALVVLLLCMASKITKTTDGSAAGAGNATKRGLGRRPPNDDSS